MDVVANINDNFLDYKEILDGAINNYINYKVLYKKVKHNIIQTSMLRFLFEICLYKKVGSDKYRYKILIEILLRYKEIDDYDETKTFNYNNITSNEDDIIIVVDFYSKGLLDQNRNKNIDNTYVLVHMIYEEIFDSNNLETDDAVGLKELYLTCVGLTDKFLERRMKEHVFIRKYIE